MKFRDGGVSIEAGCKYTAPSGRPCRAESVGDHMAHFVYLDETDAPRGPGRPTEEGFVLARDNWHLMRAS